MNAMLFNSAAINMGYRYMGVLDGNKVWGKPIGNIILKLEVLPKMENIILSSIIKVRDIDNEGQMKSGVWKSYSILKWLERYEETIDTLKYEDFERFIAYAEYENNLTSAMNCNVWYGETMAFRGGLSGHEAQIIEY